MLSYQHIYHAGNVVDCQKHAILSALLNRLHEKDTALCYIDTHSGRGLYDLQSAEAGKIREYEDGIFKLWTREDWPEMLRSYQDSLHHLNPGGMCRYYPGSPYIAHMHARPQDRSILYEIHPQELAALRNKMDGLKNVQIHNVDGWKALGKNLPPRENRGIVFIDPSYELKDDYTLMTERLGKALSLWRNGMYVIWYPMLKAGRHEVMLDMLRESGIRKILKNEIVVARREQAKGLYGTGLLLINPPWQFDETVRDISRWLTSHIGIETVTEWLVPE